jgi:hypothetical protein
MEVWSREWQEGREFLGIVRVVPVVKDARRLLREHERGFVRGRGKDVLVSTLAHRE